MPINEVISSPLPPLPVLQGRIYIIVTQGENFLLVYVENSMARSGGLGCMSRTKLSTERTKLNPL